MDSYQTFPLDKAGNIQMLILDVDGVLTDGRIILDDAGRELKHFHVSDGHGIKMLQRAGIQVAILTGRKSDVVAHRARDLGIEYVIQGSLNKDAGLSELLQHINISEQQCAYMGDDVLDIPPMRRCALNMAPRNAHLSVQKYVHWVSDYDGGKGAVRQAAEGLILGKGAWQQILQEPYGVTPADCGWTV